MPPGKYEAAPSSSVGCLAVCQAGVAAGFSPVKTLCPDTSWDRCPHRPRGPLSFNTHVMSYVGSPEGTSSPALEWSKFLMLELICSCSGLAWRLGLGASEKPSLHPSGGQHGGAAPGT